MWLVLVMLAGSLAACTDKSDFKEAGVKIVELTTAWGAAPGVEGQKNDEHILTYTLTLFNGDDNPVYIAWARPVVAATVQDQLLTETLRVPVEQEIDAGVTLDVESELRFRFAGLTKQEIDALDPVLEGVEVATQRVLRLPGQRQPEETPVEDQIEGQIENEIELQLEKES